MPRPMREAFGLTARLPAAALAIIATAAAVESVRLGVGPASRPGPGFFPFILSTLLSITAAAIGVRAGGGNEREHSVHWSLPLKAFLVLCLYGALLIPAGFIPATLIFFSLEARSIERVSLPRAFLQAAIVTAAAYGLFALLGVQLPAGWWME